MVQRRAVFERYHSPMPGRRPTAAVLLLAALVVAAAPAPIWAAQPPAAATELTNQALDLAYNLDHDQALALLHRAIAIAPAEPGPYRALASVLWLNILFRRGAVTVDHYLGAFSRDTIALPPPPPAIAAQFKDAASRAATLASQRVAARDADPQAHFDLGAALGLDASYTATVEGRMLAGFRAARRSYNEHERVLALDPTRADAGLIVGTYRYLVSTLSLPMRTLAYVAGFGGGRERGIQLIEQAARDTRASSGPRANSRTEALFALILIYNREARYDDAIAVLRQLRGLYPRNRLLVLEEAATAIRAGRPQPAQDLLTEGLASLGAERRSLIPGEEALWRYKRGLARAALARADADADLRRAIAPDAELWVQGRAHVALGRMALTRGDRKSASGEAREADRLCRRGGDPLCVDNAKTLSRSADGR